MKISENGIVLLKKLEGDVKIGNKHVIYDDKTGRAIDINKPMPRGATIGYGHLIKHGEDFKDGINENEATNLLKQDVMIAERAVQNNICVPLNQNQYDALVILCFNIGINNFATSTVIKYINDPCFHSVIYPNLQSAWLAWNKTNGCENVGLTNRRKQELELFNK